jgi:hypothetical protein
LAAMRKTQVWAFRPSFDDDRPRECYRLSMTNMKGRRSAHQPLTLGLAAFEKIIAVEGNTLTSELRQVLEAHEREAKLDTLRTDIQEGFASGPAEPLDMAEIKATARADRQS